MDVPSLEDALPIAEAAVAAGIDWLEVGTPLILGEGLHAVKALKARWPEKPVVADLKTMDAGYLECEMMAKAGASHVVVMAVAHEATVKGAVAAARDYGIEVMCDVMLCPDKPEAARRMCSLGVDYIILHTGFDERGADPSQSPLNDLAAVCAASRVPVQAVGGLSIEQSIDVVKLAPLLVFGAPVVIDAKALKPAADIPELTRRMREIVRRVGEVA